jgi:hypothetical protein
MFTRPGTAAQLGPVLSAGKDWLRLPLTLNFGEAQSDHLDGTEDQLGRPSELMTSTNWMTGCYSLILFFLL